MTRRIGLCFLAAVALAGCGSQKESVKRYPMVGEIVALDSGTHNATIKPDTEFAKLHVGDHIQATVVVQDPVYWVTGVKVTASGAGGH